MARKKKPINKSAYPDHVIETIARCLWPDIQAYYESEEGQRKFARWKTEQAEQKTGSPDKDSEESRDVTECGGIPAFYGLLVYLLCASASCCSVNIMNNPNPSPIWKNWFGLYLFGAGNRT